ncbi:Transcriptional regulatory protein DegU [compost metagenome]
MTSYLGLSHIPHDKLSTVLYDVLAKLRSNRSYPTLCRLTDREVILHDSLNHSEIEMKDALKLIYNGGIWIDQSVATRVFEEMKRQREQLEKIGSSQGNYPYGLTKREMEILEHLLSGLRYKSIAAKLFLSEGTIRNYCSILYSKLGVNNREEAIEMARMKNIV